MLPASPLGFELLIGNSILTVSKLQLYQKVNRERGGREGAGGVAIMMAMEPGPETKAVYHKVRPSDSKNNPNSY